MVRGSSSEKDNRRPVNWWRNLTTPAGVAP